MSDPVKMNGNGESEGQKSEAALAVNAMRALSVLMDRKGWMQQAGLTFDGNRALWDVFGYKKDVQPLDMFIKYKRQDVARSIVNAPADALWTRPPKIKGSPAFEDAWNALTRHIQIWDVLNRADKMTGWGRFSIIVLGLPGRLNSPARKRLELPDLLYAQPYSELGVTVDKFDTDTSSPRFGKPLLYRIRPNSADIDITNGRLIGTGRDSPVGSSDLVVHYSRVIHIADNLLEDTVYGQARLEPVYNLLDDLLKVSGGSAETYWMTANRGMQMDIDKDMTLNTADAEALSEEVEEYFHNLRRFIRTRGVKMTELGNKVADPSPTFNTLVSLISAASRIPQRILVGSEAGQLASEQDRANWAERVGERRANFAQPHALTPAILRFQSLGLLPADTSITFEWPEAFILAPLERAQTSAQKARSATNLAKTMTEQPTLISVDEARAIVSLGDVEELVTGTVNNPGSVPSTNSNPNPKRTQARKQRKP